MDQTSSEGASPDQSLRRGIEALSALIIPMVASVISSPRGLPDSMTPGPSLIRKDSMNSCPSQMAIQPSDGNLRFISTCSLGSRRGDVSIDQFNRSTVKVCGSSDSVRMQLGVV